MYKLMIFVLCAISLIACKTVPLDTIDDSIPNLTLSFGVDAEYSDGSMVEGSIDFLRRPTVQTGQGILSIPVYVTATDEESGIETVSANLTVTGFCNYSFIGRPVSDPFSVRFNGRSDPGVDDEGEAYVLGLSLINISPTDIWQRSGCYRYSSSNGRSRATLTGLEVRYNIYSKNNADLENTQTGGFEIERLEIDMPEPR